jgi:hypothetical protein
MASAQMAGDGQTVIAAAEKLGKLILTKLPVALRWCSRSRRRLFCARAVQHARDHFGTA